MTTSSERIIEDKDFAPSLSPKAITYISGHRHPDTDSIISSMAYERLINQLGMSALAVRLGEINPETAMVLDRFGFSAPPAITDVRTQIRDVAFDQVTPLFSETSLWNAWDLLHEEETRSLPVTDHEGRLLGLITSGDIAAYDMRQINEASAVATFDSLLETVSGSYVCGPIHDFMGARIYTPGVDCYLHRDGIVLGENVDRDTIARADEAHVGCLILCGSSDETDFSFPNTENTTIIRSPYNLYKTLRLVTLATSVSNVMRFENVTHFSLRDYVDDVRNAMLSTRFRSYPILDDLGHVVGMISRFHLIRHARKKVILVDHNETAQSFPGIEQAEIMEIIDHHRIGDVTTDGPIYVRNEPVGSTSTIIASMYFEKNIPLEPAMAGMLLSAILSDTIFFKSPTCTTRDCELAEELAKIASVHIEQLAEELFTPNDSLLSMTAKDLLNMDFKVFRMAGAKVAIAQISSMDISGFLSRKDDLLAQMDIDRKLEDYDMIMMALTDIRKGGSHILAAGNLGDALERAYGEQARGKNSFYLPGVMSRKKQIVPFLSMVVGV